MVKTNPATLTDLQKLYHLRLGASRLMIHSKISMQSVFLPLSCSKPQQSSRRECLDSKFYHTFRRMFATLPPLKSDEIKMIDNGGTPKSSSLGSTLLPSRSSSYWDTMTSETGFNGLAPPFPAPGPPRTKTTVGPKRARTSFQTWRGRPMLHVSLPWFIWFIWFMSVSSNQRLKS